MLRSTLLMSTKSRSSALLPSATLETRQDWSRTARKNLRKFTGQRTSIRRDCRDWAGLGQSLQSKPCAVFGNIETQLDISPLHFHIRRLHVEKQIGAGQFEEALRFVSNSRREFVRRLGGFGFENEPRFDRVLESEGDAKEIAVFEKLGVEQRGKHSVELGRLARDEAQGVTFFQSLQPIEQRPRDLEVGIDPQPHPRQRSHLAFAAD